MQTCEAVEEPNPANQSITHSFHQKLTRENLQRLLKSGIHQTKPIAYSLYQKLAWEKLIHV